MCSLCYYSNVISGVCLETLKILSHYFTAQKLQLQPDTAHKIASLLISIAQKCCHMTKCKILPKSVNLLFPGKNFLEETEFLPRDLNFYFGDF